MSTAEAAPSAAPAAGTLPGAEIIGRIRRLIIVTLLATAAYMTLTGASRGFCPGGITGDGRFLDASGQITDVAPDCITLNLKPSPLVLVALIGLVFWALSAVQRRAVDTASALRYLNRAMVIIVVLALVAGLIAHVWFRILPLETWAETRTLISPFPFGSVDMTVSPMTGP